MAEMTSRQKKPRSVAVTMPARPMRLWQDNSRLQEGQIEQEVRIEIIPLIDVIFCILTFFILAAVGFSRQQAIEFDLPKASTGTSQMREMLVVSLNASGQVYVEKEKQPLTRNQLYQRLGQYYQSSPNGLIVLHASKNASYNDVIQLLDLLRQLGGDRVALATLPEESQEPANLNPYSGSNNLSPYGTQVPGDSFNPLPPNFPLNPGQQPGSYQFNPLNPSSPGVPTVPSTTPENKN